MEFPIRELLDYEQSVEWILTHFHPKGLRCPDCEQRVEKACEFRQTKRSELTVYRCRECERIYNLYTGTVFQGRHLLTPMKTKVTTISSAHTPPLPTAKTNGLEMMMAMASAKFTSTPPRACALMSVISYDPSKGFTKLISLAMSLSPNSNVILRLSIPLSLLPLLLTPFDPMSQQIF